MWIWVIIIACIIGAIIGGMSSDNSAAEGALAGGCMAFGCLARLFMWGLCLFIVLWLFSLLFS